MEIYAVVSKGNKTTNKIAAGKINDAILGDTSGLSIAASRRVQGKR